MGVCVGEVAHWLEKLAPTCLAEEWDNVGLQVGQLDALVTRIMVSLGASQAVIDQTIENGAQLIVCHHPLIFKPLLSLRTDEPVAGAVARLIQAGIALYAAHTNLDAAPGGLGQWVGEALGLTHGKPVVKRPDVKLQKLVVYAPSDHLQAIRSAICAAGAGHIGNYSNCTFSAAGTGTFLPESGTHPFLGEVGHMAEVSETRLETIVPASIMPCVVAAMLQAHPYEEPAYDIFDLQLPSRSGYGWVGDLAAELSCSAFLQHVQAQLQTNRLRIAGVLPASVRRVAVVNGSGAGYMKEAMGAGADILVTGDVRYHDAEAAQAARFCIVDAGHFATESLVRQRLATYLRQHICNSGCEVLVARETDTIELM